MTSDDGAVGDPIVWPLNQAVKPDDINQAANMFSWYFDPSDSQLTPYTYTYHNGTWVEKFLDIDSNGNILHSWQRPLNLAVPYDAYAVMAYGAESKTKGLGATANVGGAFVKAGQVNVASAFDPSNDFTPRRYDHSGQFHLDNMSRWEYWNVLMQRIGLASSRTFTPAVGGRP